MDFIKLAKAHNARDYDSLFEAVKKEYDKQFKILKRQQEWLYKTDGTDTIQMRNKLKAVTQGKAYLSIQIWGYLI